MQKNKALRKWIIIITAYALCIAAAVALLFSVSGAKYRSKINAYAGFNPASFNAFFLGDNHYENLVVDKDVKMFHEDLELKDYYPGMDSVIIPFTVVNGTSTGDASGVSVEYAVKIRFSGNIPLQFRLRSVDEELVSTEWVTVTTTAEETEDPEDPEEVSGEVSGEVPGEDDDETTVVETTLIRHYDTSYDEKAGSDGFYITGHAHVLSETAKERDENVIWREYCFYTEYEEEGSENNKEIIFYLDGGNLNMNRYELEITWPVANEGVATNDEGKFVYNEGHETIVETYTKPTNSADYMKEVEMLEIFARVSGLNYAGETTVAGQTTSRIPSSDDPYGQGLVVLDKTKYDGKLSNVYRYDAVADLRAFGDLIEKDEDGNDKEEVVYKYYPFTVMNGFNQGIVQTSEKINYTVGVLVPYNSYTYLVFDDLVNDQVRLGTLNSDGQYDILHAKAVEYRSYNIEYDTEGYGTYTTLAEAPSNEDIAKYTNSNSKRLYAYVTFKVSNVIETEREYDIINFEKKMGDTQYTARHDEDKFRVYITATDYALLNLSNTLDNIAFENKIIITVNATFSDPPKNDAPSGTTAGEGGGE